MEGGLVNKATFIAQYPGYGLSGMIDKVRRDEFTRLADQVYVDAAGAALYSERQLDHVMADMKSSLYGNPHSRNASSSKSTDAVDAMRARVLHHFNTSRQAYSVIFTANATAALKLAAETFPWTQGSQFCYLLQNHTSVLGMREVAASYGASFRAVRPETLGTGVDSSDDEAGDDPRPRSPMYARFLHPYPFAMPLASLLTLIKRTHRSSGSGGTSSADTGKASHLFAFPGECNLSGERYPLAWIESVQRNMNGQWYILLDAAALAAHTSLDLSQHSPHFVTVSFYKLFGYPTGVGALIVRNDVLPMLRKGYFGGGTVTGVVSDRPWHELRPAGPGAFEDGTVPFLDIAALRHGFDFIERLGGINAIDRHTFALAQLFSQQIGAIKHMDGGPLARVFGRHLSRSCDVSSQGPIVAFHVLYPDGSVVGYADVDTDAELAGIHLRVGCVCNVGACHLLCKLTPDDVSAAHRSGHICGDANDAINGKPRGIVRVSFGYHNTYDDVVALLNFLRSNYLDRWPETQRAPSATSPSRRTRRSSSNGTSSSNNNNGSGGGGGGGGSGGGQRDAAAAPASKRDKRSSGNGTASPSPLPPPRQHRSGKTIAAAPTTSSRAAADTQPLPPQSGVCAAARSASTSSSPSGSRRSRHHSRELSITSITVYPVKSCGGFSPNTWPLTSTGLLYDRTWMVVDDAGAALSQKKVPRLSLVRPSIDLVARVLRLDAPDMPTLTIPLDSPATPASLSSRVCDADVQATPCGFPAAQWFSKVAGRPCSLVRQHSSAAPRISRSGASLSLVNQGQLLLVAQESVDELRRMVTAPTVPITATLFRPNIVVSGAPAWAEDAWTGLASPDGDIALNVAGPCTRCRMVCVDARTGVIAGPEPLHTLARHRRRSGKILFGLLLDLAVAPDADAELRAEAGALRAYV